MIPDAAVMVKASLLHGFLVFSIVLAEAMPMCYASILSHEDPPMPGNPAIGHAGAAAQGANGKPCRAAPGCLNPVAI
jgi:hypothetical protein